MSFQRNCPNSKNNLECKTVILYQDKRDFKKAIKRNSQCLSCAHFGILQSEYTRGLKRSKNIERYKNPEERIKLGKYALGSKRSKETKEKMRLAHLGHVVSLESRLRMSQAQKLKFKNPIERKKISDAMKKYDGISKLNAKRQRGHFYNWLKGRNNGFEKYVTLSLNEFKIYISLKFKKEMTWLTHGFTTWHLDHIIPLCNFELITENGCKRAWHYTNFQPLWAKDNLKKNSKLIYSILED